MHSSQMGSSGNISSDVLSPNRNWDTAVRKIKQMLSSRVIKQQTHAVNILIEMIKKDVHAVKSSTTKTSLSVTSKLIDSDILQFLCVKTSERHGLLARSIFECLGLLITSENFTTQNHPSIALEYLIPITNLIMKEKGNSRTLNYVIRLLTLIIERFHSISSNSETILGASYILQIVDVVIKLFESPFYLVRDTLLIAGLLLASIFKEAVLGRYLDPGLVQALASAISGCYKVLSTFLNPKDRRNSQKHDGVAKAVDVMAQIGMNATELHTSFRLEDKECYLRNQQDKNMTDPFVKMYTDKILNVVLQNVVNVTAPYITTVNIDPLNMKMYCSFFKCIKALYSAPIMSHECTQLSHKLADAGFLSLIPLLSGFSTKCPDDSRMRATYLTCLADILWSLSCDVLDVQDYPLGADGLRAHLLQGTQNLHKNPDMWFNALCQKQVSESYMHTIILFCYFYMLSNRSSEGCSPKLLPALISMLNKKYLRPLYCNTSPVIVKALWLIFADCSLNLKSKVAGLETATDVLLGLLEKYQLREVFTSHPVLLKWTFSSCQMSSVMRKKVINFWLENNSPEVNTILVKLLVEHNNAGSHFLDAIQYVRPNIAENAISILHEAIDQQEQDGNLDLIDMLWENMPKVLTNVNSKKSLLSPKSIGLLLELISDEVPLHVNMTSAFNTACLLTSVLINQAESNVNTPIVFYTGVIQHAFLLLLLSMDMRDERIYMAFVRNERFLRVLEKATRNMDPILCSRTYTLLSYLLAFQAKQITTLSCNKGVVINTGYLLESLMSSNQSLLVSTLQLIYVMLKSKLEHPVVILGLSTDASEFLYSLQLHVQSLCFKFQQTNQRISDCCWKCLSASIRFTYTFDSNILNYVINEAWIHDLVMQYSSSTETGSFCLSQEFLQFLCEWLPYYKRKEITMTSHLMSTRKARKPTGKGVRLDLITTTLVGLATALLSTDDFNETKRNLVKKVIKEILLADVILPESEVHKLQEYLEIHDY